VSTRLPFVKDSPEHRRYLRSPEWKARRMAAIVRAGFRCGDCGRVVFDARKLQAHHLTYERLGCERPEDIAIRCARCHRRISTW
jgi:hypothetical protein